MIATRVAVLASSHDHCHHLQAILEDSGLEIVVNDVLSDDFLNKLNSSEADVLLVDIGEVDDSSMDLVDEITENSSVPVLFNDSGPEGVNLESQTDVWSKKLAKKLVKLADSNSIDDIPELTNNTKTNAKAYNQPEVTDEFDFFTETAAIEIEDTSYQDLVEPVTDMLERNVWVLGASLGGPQAVRQFLSTITEDLPVTFILAQHIGANHVNLLAEQLNRVTQFNVVPGINGHKLSYGEVVLAPADKQLSFTDDGFIALGPAPPGSIYSPSIDNVMSEVARKFGNNAGTIIFSGMGDDGKVGCDSIAEMGGIVWAQDIASCVVSSMPDHARKTGKVSFSAKPEQLAKQLHEFLCP